jgi:hypothetical protein
MDSKTDGGTKGSVRRKVQVGEHETRYGERILGLEKK